MQETEIINLWKSGHQKLDTLLALNRKNAEDITRLKVQSLLSSMKPIKIFTIAVGILWVLLIDSILIATFPFASPFFMLSAGIQSILTKIAIGIYLYQLILLHQPNIDESILAAQGRIARLTSSTLWVTRILFLQLPVWTTFYINQEMIENGNFVLWGVQIVVTALFTYAALWLFINIRYSNKDKKWFRLLFAGKEWTPVMQSFEMLRQIDAVKQEDGSI